MASRTMPRPSSGVQTRALDLAGCELAEANGLEERCYVRCPFWEEGGAVLPAGCRIARTGAELERGDLAHLLLELRRRLDTAVSPDERLEVEALVRRVLALELEDDVP